MPRNKFLTPRQRELIETIGPRKEDFHITYDKIGVTMSNRDTMLSHIFQKYLQALRCIAENAKIFENRLRIHNAEIQNYRRTLRRNLRTS